MPTVTIAQDADLDELRRASSKLYRRRPCQQRINCLAREKDRKLTQDERCQFPEWQERPYETFDVNRMCRSCQAFWFAEVAARLYDEPPGIIVGEGQEERPKLPQKG